MNYLLYVVLAGTFTWLFTRMQFVRRSGLSKAEVAAFFLLRLAASLILGYIVLAGGEMSTDYGTVNYYGRYEYHQLLEHPASYLHDLYASQYGHYGGFFRASHSFWNEWKNNILYKTVGVLDLLTRGNYYINALFFNAGCFAGQILLFRVFNHAFPQARKALMISCFLIPSLIYFTSGMHKDAVVFTCLCIIMYAVYFSLYDKASLKRIVIGVLAFLLLMMMRNYVAVILLPCLAAFIMAVRYKINAWAATASVFAAIFLCFWILNITSGFHPFKAFAERQQSFLSVPSHTDVTHKVLGPTSRDAVYGLPKAINVGFFRPFPLEFNGIINIPAFEWYACLAIILSSIALQWKKHRMKYPPFVCCLLTFSILMILVIGYTIPNAGSIVRYRSLYVPFLLTPMLNFLAEYNIKKNYM